MSKIYLAASSTPVNNTTKVTTKVFMVTLLVMALLVMIQGCEGKSTESNVEEAAIIENPIPLLKGNDFCTDMQTIANFFQSLYKYVPQDFWTECNIVVTEPAKVENEEHGEFCKTLYFMQEKYPLMFTERNKFIDWPFHPCLLLGGASENDTNSLVDTLTLPTVPD